MRPTRRALLPAIVLPCLLLAPAAHAVRGTDARCSDVRSAASAQRHSADGVLEAGGLACRTTPTLAPARLAAAAAPAPRLVLSSPAVVPYGSGRAVSVTGARPGARVDLYAYSLPNTTYRLIRRSRLNAQGVASWTLHPGGHTSLYAVVSGVRSNAATMRVARTATLDVRQAAGVYRFSGVVRPPVAGLQVTVARVLRTGQVVGIGATRTDAAGGYALDLRLSPGMSLYYVLTPATPDLLGARSRNYGIDVPAPPARPLAGRTVTLDPGHNGGNAAHPEIVNRRVHAGGGLYKPCNTVGTATARGYPEHSFTWDVSRRAAALLRAQGAEVVLTRPGDAGVGPCIDRRAAIANRAGSDAVVSVHADGSTRAGARGFHVIAPMSPPVAGGVAARSNRLARQLRAAFRATTAIPYANYVAGGDGLDARRDLGGLNLSTRPVVFIECGNMRNGQDAALMTSAAGRQRIAAGIARGIADHLRR